MKKIPYITDQENPAVKEYVNALKKNKLPTVKPKMINTKRFIKTANAARESYEEQWTKDAYALREVFEDIKLMKLLAARKRRKWPVVNLDHPENNCSFCGCDHHYKERIYGITPEVKDNVSVGNWGGYSSTSQPIPWNETRQSPLNVRLYGVTPEAREELGEKDNFWTWAYIIFLLLLTVIVMMVLPWRT